MEKVFFKRLLKKIAMVILLLFSLYSMFKGIGR